MKNPFQTTGGVSPLKKAKMGAPGSRGYSSDNPYGYGSETRLTHSASQYMYNPELFGSKKRTAAAAAGGTGGKGKGKGDVYNTVTVNPDGTITTTETSKSATLPSYKNAWAGIKEPKNDKHSEYQKYLKEADGDEDAAYKAFVVDAEAYNKKQGKSSTSKTGGPHGFNIHQSGEGITIN